MPVKLFVGGLSFTTSQDGLRAAFARFGVVTSAVIMNDRETGRSRGFGFVEMSTPEEADQATSGLNGSFLDGRAIRVDKATPRGTGPRPAGGPGDRRGGFSDRRSSGPPGQRPSDMVGQRPGGPGSGERRGGGGPPRDAPSGFTDPARARRGGGKRAGAPPGGEPRRGSGRPSKGGRDEQGGGGGRRAWGDDGNSRPGR
jgi:hypothetical protein